MYAGFAETPAECIRDWIRIAMETGTAFTHFHHHLIYMLERHLSRSERRLFNALSSTAAVLDYMDHYLSITDP